ncbi:NEJ1 (YLR265C) [Zygosaccharomyces parabailii]|uniref:BN860_02234g1_1 n=1 Tax=Zygosaccharomyces bailii (strain CLIB 213 / ATCC 58445 / CBS 680 / BCRC 21525 / NBRC 1098 / NCYC 1416 / NRRL Y-2227) TaxID=1333698 RepID=A0A8J2X4Q4_ZYGB2|nr:NEJ1 (YLR265C) [Zygosaccharomyces parabailii]CDF87253.1 BN860_02234g1_1 [Zygosaccharomyces bailii CLIB 213]CDH15679.1 uncharacterized protein ZBAI_07466 [Zygosaccharomyces bailii ISA1307]
MEKEIETLLVQGSFDQWNVGTIGHEKIFFNSQGSNQSHLLFCFTPLKGEPFVVFICDLEEQCRKQGFLDKSIAQIKEDILSRVSSAFAFHREGQEIRFVVTVSSLEVTLRAPLTKISDHLCTKMYQMILKNILEKTCLLQGIADDFLFIIESKDKAIEYLKDNVEELGGERIISRWAPQGSYNFKSLEKYTPPIELQSCLAGSNDPMEAAESLTILKPHFRNYTRSPSRTPNKRKRQLSANKLVNRDLSSRNLIPLLNQEQADLAELKRRDPSPRRAVSDSPSKRQKFGRVKITKGR